MMNSVVIRPLAVLAVVISPLLGACADESPAGPDVSMSVVAGEYEAGGSFGALTFRTTEGNEQIDWRAAGAILTLELSASGTVTGRLHIPVVAGHEDYFEAEDVERGYMEADMAGTWTLANGVVRFEQDADSFIRDLEFTYNDGVLAAEKTFDGVAVTVVLVQQ